MGSPYGRNRESQKATDIMKEPHIKEWRTLLTDSIKTMKSGPNCQKQRTMGCQH